jgi:Fe-S cluster biosynthesis and repair protein YggX
MKIRQALINLSENKLEEMNKNLRQALTQKAAEMLEEKKMEMANMFFNDK